MSFSPLIISHAHGWRTDSAGIRAKPGDQRTTGEKAVGCFEDKLAKVSVVTLRILVF
jgi:hypothetical protein